MFKYQTCRRWISRKLLVFRRQQDSGHLPLVEREKGIHMLLNNGFVVYLTSRRENGGKGARHGCRQLDPSSNLFRRFLQQITKSLVSYSVFAPDQKLSSGNHPLWICRLEWSYLVWIMVPCLAVADIAWQVRKYMFGIFLAVEQEPRSSYILGNHPVQWYSATTQYVLSGIINIQWFLKGNRYIWKCSKLALNLGTYRSMNKSSDNIYFLLMTLRSRIRRKYRTNSRYIWVSKA